jgi:hypothetical protein
VVLYRFLFAPALLALAVMTHGHPPVAAEPRDPPAPAAIRAVPLAPSPAPASSHRVASPGALTR